MSLVKSFAVGNGDMFYIQHDTDNFSIIDCSLPDDREEEILEIVPGHLRRGSFGAAPARSYQRTGRQPAARSSSMTRLPSSAKKPHGSPIGPRMITSDHGSGACAAS